MGVFVFLWKLGDKSNSEQNIIASVFFGGNITGVMLVVHCNVIKPSKHWRVEITTTIVFFFLGGGITFAYRGQWYAWYVYLKR